VTISPTWVKNGPEAAVAATVAAAIACAGIVAEASAAAGQKEAKRRGALRTATVASATKDFPRRLEDTVKTGI
jgi:hypothetical protein